MNSNSPETWHAANQRHLMAAIADLRASLEKAFGLSEDPSPENQETVHEDAAAQNAASIETGSSALETLCAAFDLSSFEREILLMCAAPELDSRFSALYAAAHKDPRRLQPTFSLALAAFSDSHWTALSPARPLRHWKLIEVLPGESLTGSPLRVPERVLHYLAGVPCIEERLAPLVKHVAPPSEFAPSHRALADRLASVWSRSDPQKDAPIIELCGDESGAKMALAAAGCALLGMQLHVISATAIPRNMAEMETFLRLWEREAVLSSSALLIDFDESEGSDGLPASDFVWLAEQIRSPLIVAARGSRRCGSRASVLFDVRKPTASEQADIWKRELAARLPAVNGEVDPLVAQFNLNANTIRNAADQALSGTDSRQGSAGSVQHSASAERVAEQLWDACRRQSRPRLEGLAQRIDSVSSWDDLVLPEKQKETLAAITIHVRQRAKVYREWGFASKCTRGLGISALFAGPSGTGKTMAAEVLASDLRLDLYRIDLSQIVSKYVGETEKNLRRVFDAAEEGATVLLFDEADALFGKRSEVKDSHDRYANIEVSYLLQRMEAYRGLSILTTNRKSAIDQAFMRRIRFVVEFPYPEPAQRAEIWRRVFPASTPTAELRIDRLARLNAAGGHIRNIAMGAAFLAADAGEPVHMRHLLSAARSEFAKLEKPLTDAEIAGWV